MLGCGECCGRVQHGKEQNCVSVADADYVTVALHFPCMFSSVVTKAVDAETKTEAAGFETEAKTETVASETEAVYLKTEAEAQGSWPILLTVLSSGAVLAQKLYPQLLHHSFSVLRNLTNTNFI